MANLFDLMGGFLKTPVGNDLDNHPDDILRTKRNFKTLGLYQGDHTSPYIDRELTNAILTFQKDKKLRVDGFMRPDGETEQAIQSSILRAGRISENPLAEGKREQEILQRMQDIKNGDARPDIISSPVDREARRRLAVEDLEAKLVG